MRRRTFKGETGVKDATCLLEGVDNQSGSKVSGQEGRP